MTRKVLLTQVVSILKQGDPSMRYLGDFSDVPILVSNKLRKAQDLDPKAGCFGWEGREGVCGAQTGHTVAEMWYGGDSLRASLNY